MEGIPESGPSEELVDRLSKFNLSRLENDGIELEEQDVTISKEECRRSLIGRVHGVKKANFSGLKSTLTRIWLTGEAFTTRELGNNFFQFVFKSQSDKLKILQGRRQWSFDQQYLVLRDWSQSLLLKEEEFQVIELWTQIWNLPNQCLSKEVGYKIGKMFLHCGDVIIPDTGSSKGRHIKIRAKIDVSKPLLRGTFVRLAGCKHWVAFKYEKLLNFCFHCGRVGHSDVRCDKRREDSLKNVLLSDQYGEWLKADVGNNKQRVNSTLGKQKLELGMEKVISSKEGVDQDYTSNKTDQPNVGCDGCCFGFEGCSSGGMCRVSRGISS